MKYLFAATSVVLLTFAFVAPAPVSAAEEESACSIQFRAAASRPIAVVPMTVFKLHWGSAGDPKQT